MINSRAKTIMCGSGDLSAVWFLGSAFGRKHLIHYIKELLPPDIAGTLQTIPRLSLCAWTVIPVYRLKMSVHKNQLIR